MAGYADSAATKQAAELRRELGSRIETLESGFSTFSTQLQSVDTKMERQHTELLQAVRSKGKGGDLSLAHCSSSEKTDFEFDFFDLFVFDLNKDKVLCTVSTVFIHLTLTLTRTLIHREFCSIAEAPLVILESSAALTVGGFDGSDFTAEPSPVTSENTGLNQLLLPTLALR